MIAVEPVWLACIAVVQLAVVVTIMLKVDQRPLLVLALAVAVTVGFTVASGRPPASWQPRPAHHERACTQTIVQDQLGVWQVVCR